jgi:transcriptional regulator with XRE-family HTH domain
LNASESALAALGARLRELRGQRRLTLQRLASEVGYSHQHLGAVERAQVVPSEAVVRACDAALSANGALTTMFPRVVSEQAERRHRNGSARRSPIGPGRCQPPAMNARSADAGYIDWHRLADAARRPSRVSPAVVESLEQVTDQHRHLYHELSSAEMLTHVRAHLGLLTSFLRAHQVPALYRRIASAAAEAAGFAAWLCYDLGDFSSAYTHYRQAQATAAEATDRGLDAYIMAYQGTVALHSDRPGSAQMYMSKANSMAPATVSATAKAWLTILLAETTAHAGERQAAVATAQRSRELLERAKVTDRDPWMFDFDSGSLAAHTGRTYLAVGQPEQAADAFREALGHVPSRCDRRGARIRIGLARALLASGEAEEAHSLGTIALMTFAERGSAAGLRDFGALCTDFREAGQRRFAALLEEHARELARSTR